LEHDIAMADEKIDKPDSPSGAKSSAAGEISQGVHLGCGGHALAIIIILVLAQFSTHFFLGLAAIGVLQLLYVIPSIRVMKNWGLSRNVLRGFWATAWVMVVFNVIGLAIWKFAWPTLIS
jgi:hypothetical protein